MKLGSILEEVELNYISIYKTLIIFLSMADINLYSRGNVIVFNGIGGSSNYNPFVGQTTDYSELIDRICEFVKGEELILRSMTSHEPLLKGSSKIPKLKLEEIGKSIKEKGIKIKGIF